jgi:calpain-15
LNIDGEWKNIIVDDFIPCKKNKPAFSRANGNEIWVLLLEKAYAKAYGSYYRIEGGNPAVALRDLTGAPYCNFDVKDPDEMFKFLIEHDKGGKGDILTCYTASTAIREE